MQELVNAINKALQLLQQVNAATLTADLLKQTGDGLNSIDINAALKAAAQSFPAKPENEDGSDDYQKQINSLTDNINKELAPLNEVLEKVKQLRQTLNLDALDPIIKSAQKLIRPVYTFTSSL